MNDEKRWLRQLKKQIKKQGKRKRRRFLKNVNTDPDDFNFRGDCSEAMNEPAPRSRQSRTSELPDFFTESTED